MTRIPAKTKIRAINRHRRHRTTVRDVRCNYCWRLQSQRRQQQAAPRPPRPAYIQNVLDTATLSVDSTAHVSESCVPAAQQSHGRHLYKEIMTHSHRQFYDKVMRQCAERYVPLHMIDSSTDIRLDADAPASYFSLPPSILQATLDSVGTNGSRKSSRTFSTHRQIHYHRPPANCLRTYQAYPSPTIPEILSARHRALNRLSQE